MADDNLTSLLSTLESDTSGKDDKIEKYTVFVKNLKGDELSLFSLDVSKNVSRIVTVVQRDILDDCPEINQGALQVTGYCLHDGDIVSHLTLNEAKSTLSVLCQCVLKTESKTTCTRALWCLSKQKLSPSDVGSQVHSILCALEHAVNKWKSQTVIVDNEAVNVFKRLLEQVHSEMEVETIRWSKLLLPFLVHSAPKIRESVRELVTGEMSTLLNHQEKLSQSMLNEFKSKIGPELKKLFVAKDEVHVLKCWELFVQIFGKELHHGSFINHLLSVIELAFKSPSAEVKCTAFEAWQQLIDNFATNTAILTDPKRVKLIMQVFKVIVAKIEPVAMVKLRVWWHYSWLMGPKLSSYFDQVCVPLLQFCIGGSKIGNHGNLAGTPRILQNGTSPATPRLNLTTPGTNHSQIPTFRNLQLKACEVLSHILGSVPTDLDVPSHNFTLDPLTHAVITGPTFFIKQANLFITCSNELMSNLGSDIPEGLLFRIWYSLIAHINNILESGVKHDIREILTTFLTQFQILVLSRSLPTKTVLKMFQAICCLPKKALCSTAYNINNGEKIHGNPALFLTELLLTPVLLKCCTTHESYLSLFNKLIDCGFGNPSGSLEFGKSVLQLLNRNVQFIDNAETIWRFWNGLAHTLHEDIAKTNEVNQGDSLEPNFSCMYAVLIFPITHKLATKMPFQTVKLMQKTWSDIYRTFARLSALVTNAEPNICCEDLCRRVLDVIGGTELEDVTFLDFMSQMCLVVINTVDFSSMGSVTNFNLNALSPAKWSKRKQKPLENLHSYISLVHKLMDATTSHHSLSETPKKSSSQNVSLQGPANNLVEILTVLFTHTSASSIVSNLVGHLAQPVSEFFNGASKKTGNKIYNNVFIQKLEKLWMDICTCIQSKYSGLYETDFLQEMSPLLESTFLHSRRNIKNQTIVFWNSTFSRSSSLVYPENLKSVLIKVKQKTTINLPGWIVTDTPVIEETPLSQMSQADAPEPHIPGMPSPGKLHGSFLHKAVSPNVKHSPAKAEPKAVGVVKKKLMPMTDVTNDDFVVIKTAPKKKQVLTEHQKEVMKEKRVFPTMYNSLDLSQDTSMMARFGSESQSATPSPCTDSVIILDSSGSQNKDPIVVNDSEDKNKESENNKEISDTGKNKNNRTSEKEQNNTKIVRLKDNKDANYSEKDGSFKIPGRRESIEKTKNSDAKKIPEKVIVDEEASKVLDKEASKVLNSKDNEESSSKCIHHFSVIKDTLNSSQGEKGSSTKSSSLTSEGETAPQNVLGAIGMLDSYESKTSSTSTENGNKNTISESGSESLDDSEQSEPLLNWTKELKRLKTNNKEDEQKSESVGLDKSNEHFPKKSARRRTPNSKYRDDFEVDEYSQELRKGSLDDWLIRSPNRGVARNKKPGSFKKTKSLPLSLESVPLPSGAVTVVEETQSPTKMNQISKESTALPSILETPPRPGCDSNDSVGSNKGSSRKLFSQDNKCDDNDIIPGSPPLKINFAGKIGTPVLKLKKLTDKEILSYSPTRKEKRAENETTPLKIGPITCSSSVEDVDEAHEHDDFSQIKPLDFMGSQGFELSSQSKDNKRGSDVSCSVEKNLNDDKMEDDNMPPVLEPMESQDILQCGQQTGTESEIQENLGSKQIGLLSENLFTPCHSEAEYNPDLNSTFKNSDSTQVLDQENLKEKGKLSEASESEDLSQAESENSDVPGTYNPENVSTLAENSYTPRRGRKRKQHTPKRFEESEKFKSKRRKRSKNGSKDLDNSLENNVQEKSSESKTSVEENSEKIISKADEKVDQQNNDKSCDEKENFMSEEDKKEEVLDSTDKISGPDKSEKTDLGKVESVCIGEKTPETKIIEVAPVRKSTTKKKKEVAHRRSLNKEKKDSRLTDSDGSEDSQQGMSEIPSENSGLKVQDVDGSKVEEDKVASCRLSSDDDIPLNQVFVKNKSEKDEELEIDREKVISSEGSDDVPLSQIMKLQNDETVDTKSDSMSEDIHDSDDVFNTCTKENQLDVDSSQPKYIECKLKRKGKASGKTSPLSNRLRSSGRVLRTRGKPMRRIPDLNVNDTLLLKSKRRKSEGDLKQDLCDIESSLIENSELLFNEDIRKDDTNLTDNKNDEVDSGSNKNEKELVNNTDSMNINETPKKATEKEASVSFPEFPVTECHSDSKLVTASRKFERKPIIARRSILKQSTLKSHPETSLSPKRNRFHPIRIHHAVSPAASPSAGILKRRRLSGNLPSNSPSPPSKQRRVSFATPITSGKSRDNPESSSPTLGTIRMDTPRPASPLVTTSSTRITTTQEKFLTTPSGSDSCSSSPAPDSNKESQFTQTQNSYKSTQESQLNTIDPVYPELVKCGVAVDKLLPQLTSSMWVRGLDQLVRARNIYTVGDLSALSEREVHELPIKSPKVANVRKALKKFESQQELKKSKLAKTEVVEPETPPRPETVTCPEPAAPEPFIAESDPSTSDPGKATESVDDILNSSADLLDEVAKLTSQENEQSMSPTSGQSRQRNIWSEIENMEKTGNSPPKSNVCKSSIMQSLNDLVRTCNSKEIDQLKTHEIFQLHSQLSGLMTTVVSALKDRCHSPEPSDS